MDGMTVKQTMTDESTLDVPSNQTLNAQAVAEHTPNTWFSDLSLTHN